MHQASMTTSPNRRLLEARLKHGWSQREVAAQLGTTFVNVSRWERGITLPGAYYRRQICELFGKRPQELGFLLGRSDEEVQTACADSFVSPDTLPATSYQDMPLWLVPYQHNPFFTGRESALQWLHDTLHPQAQTAMVSQSSTLSGLGGIGKTQTALEYAYRHASDYKAIFWISAETSESIFSSFLAIADLLNLPEQEEQRQQNLIAAVLHWLRQQDNWLLIFDDTEDVQLVKSVLPATHHGSLLFTSRHQGLDISAHCLSLEKMTFEESLRFFQARARLLETASDQDAPSLSENSTVREIVSIMDGLPLAIDQAGAYIEATRCNLSDYLQLLRAHSFSLLNERDRHADHPLSVTKSFLLAFEQLEQTHREAVEMLTVCAYLAPEALTETFFLEGAAWLGPTFEEFAANTLKFQAAMKALLSYSLLQRNPVTRTVTIHRLVQAVLKSSQPETTQRNWTARVLNAMGHLFPSDEERQSDYWHVCEKLLPHALACVTLWEQWEAHKTQHIPWLCHVAAYLVKRARHAEALSLIQRILRVGEQELEPEHPLLAYPLYELADLFLTQGQYTKAEPLFQRVLGIREQAFGGEHPLVAITLGKLGFLYRERGMFEQAEFLYMQSLSIWEQTQRINDLQLAYTLNNLGILYCMQGKLEEAEPLFLRTLQIRQQQLGTEHTLVASGLDNLAALYLRRNRNEEAKPLFQQALGIWEKALRSDHPQVACSLNNLAIICARQQDHLEAAPLFQRVLSIWEKALGPEHPQVAMPLHNMAELFANQGKHEQAQQLLQRVISIREQALGSEHPDTAEALDDLAISLVAQGKFQEARLIYERTLGIREQALGSEHPHTELTRKHLEALLNREEDKTPCPRFLNREEDKTPWPEFLAK